MLHSYTRDDEWNKNILLMRLFFKFKQNKILSKIVNKNCVVTFEMRLKLFSVMSLLKYVLITIDFKGHLFF